MGRALIVLAVLAIPAVGLPGGDPGSEGHQHLRVEGGGAGPISDRFFSDTVLYCKRVYIM